MTPLLKLIKKQDTISLIILILLIPVVTRLSKRVNFIYILLTSNYITLILNITYLVIMYKKVMIIINGINHTLITRKGYKNSKQNIYAFMIMATLLFLAILYGFLFLVYGISQMSIKLLLMLVIYTLTFLFEISIIYLQFNRKSNILYIALPIIINLAYHYMFF